MRTIGHKLTVFARAIRVGRRPLHAEQRLCEKARGRGLARSAWTAEQVSVRHLVLPDRIFQRALNGLLPDDVFKHLRTIFPIQRKFHDLPHKIGGQETSKVDYVAWSRS